MEEGERNKNTYTITMKLMHKQIQQPMNKISSTNINE